MVGNPSLLAERARLTKAKADIAEMENQRMLGEPVPAAQVGAVWAEIAGHIRAHI
jgi:phage terminase Nu1 subunit (DNA packaging protein)